MTLSKRLFDVVLALLLGLLLLPVIALIALIVLLRDGAPVFYISERMRAFDEGFGLVKFRTMTVAEADSGVSGGDKAARITPTGRVLRRTRLDELPQLWNVLVGDISFVGPRPPLRQYVERFPEVYREVLKARPGITGLATIVYHGHEERLLARCRTLEETDAVYTRACVPRKARLDLIYRDNRSLCMDLALMWRTAARRRG
ncbi:sugar transferase [Oceanicola granulosus HTCC2516]|uniref:Sugar transferase n=1 Tax=Oceanicola granulosus (strain ATCC BAA-861 / DSM 15982 / KCTC 12143 / HTCC2516) TaxID=314256 RepID=Q2CFK4_OCEGH|nr:sugar transferase [Oceanicola granulosus]EAR51478.1 sugar transferase [Oceanicola granulosus HTCC2516]